MIAMLAGWALGTAQGMRHALEPDHVAAVSTMVAEQRSRRASVVYAASWGAGHALVLTLVGGALFALHAEMPERLGELFELLVGVMLVLLGLRAIRQALAFGQMSKDAKEHPVGHGHAHTPDAARVETGWRAARRPVAIGVVHGLAGSGALSALVVARLPSVAEGLVFLLLYGAGAMIGMALLASVAGGPLARLANTAKGMPVLLVTSGVLSAGLGLFWGYFAAFQVVSSAISAR